METLNYAELDEIIDMLVVVFDVQPNDGKISLSQFVLWYEGFESSRVVSSRQLNLFKTELDTF